MIFDFFGTIEDRKSKRLKNETQKTPNWNIDT